MTATNDEVCAIDKGEAILSCSTKNNWKTCIWSFNRKICNFEYVFNEGAIADKWTHDEVSCDPEFGDHEFIPPENYEMGNNNTKCGIKLKQFTSYSAGEYKCNFLSCNLEENNMCKTKVSKNCPVYLASINVKVHFYKSSKNYLILNF